MATYEMCIECGKRPTLRAARSRLCSGCAKALGVCQYCGGVLADEEKGNGVCSWCVPTPSPGMGNSVRGWERADLQYHGSLVE